MKFLVIDDDRSIRQMVVSQLRQAFPGAELEEIDQRSGLEAALERGGFDLVLTDYYLGWADGLDVLGIVQERFPHIPVVMVTATGSEEVAVEGMKAGLSDYVLKRHLRRLPVAVQESLEKARLRREHEAALQRLRESEEQLRRYANRLVEAEEMERRRVARELHDEIGQALTALKINLQAAQQAGDPAEVAASLEESLKLVERTLQQVRDLSLDLHPSLLDDLGLVPALRWYVDRQARWTGLELSFTADPFEARLAPDLEVTGFRAVQEALTNVVRHAQARRVEVELRQREGGVYLTIRDDGIGFDAPAALERAARGASLGLLSMQERVLLAGGEVEIDSAPGRGTEVRVRLPLQLAEDPSPAPWGSWTKVQPEQAGDAEARERGSGVQCRGLHVPNATPGRTPALLGERPERWASPVDRGGRGELFRE